MRRHSFGRLAIWSDRPVGKDTKGRANSGYGIALPLFCYLKNAAKNQG